MIATYVLLDDNVLVFELLQLHLQIVDLLGILSLDLVQVVMAVLRVLRFGRVLHHLLLQLHDARSLILDLVTQASVLLLQLLFLVDETTQLVVNGALAEHIEQLGRLGRDQGGWQHRLDLVVLRLLFLRGGRVTVCSTC